MQNVIGNGQVIASAPNLSAYRRGLLDMLAAAPVIKTEEYDTATARILACQCLSTLQRWVRNCTREIIRREEATITLRQAAEVSYKKAVTIARRLTVRRNEVFEQLNPMRADGFPVYISSENPNRAKLDAAHRAAIKANEVARGALDYLQSLPYSIPAVRYATAQQCDELYRLACHPALTLAEKTQALGLLPSLTEGTAVTYIGELYAKVLPRTGQVGWRENSTLVTA